MEEVCEGEGIQATLTLTDTDNNIDLATMTAALRKLSNFLQPALTFLNCHFTDYYLKSYWNTLIPESLRHDLETKSLDEVKNCMVDLTTGKWKSYPEAEGPETWNFQNATRLEQLIATIGKLKLPEQKLCTSYNSFKSRRNSLKEHMPDLFVDLEFDKFMSSKKMHEVFKFSEFIACACDNINLSNDGLETELIHKLKLNDRSEIRHIVDVGSGKGYLSSFLSLYYGLQVLAIDASASNTEGCDKRAAKLDKAWPQLVRRAKERQLNGTCVNFGKNWRKWNKKVGESGLTMEEYKNQLKSQFHPAEGNLKSITEMITTKTDLHSLIKLNFEEESVESKDENDSLNKCGIIGLHTCGNLGANILKLFVHNEQAHFICVAPCCYNLVQEDESLYPENVFFGSKYGYADGTNNCKLEPWCDGSIGFPLSTILKDFSKGKPYVVGRNARMLSAYSLPRMLLNDPNLEMSPVLYYRTMLQLLFKRHNLLPADYGTQGGTNEVNEIRVGRMTKDCTSFMDYVDFAIKKTFPEHLETILNEGSIKEIETKYASPEMLQRFHKYYLLRTMFASVVEDLILLDRLVYLLEQDSISSASVVQLFDPALSPRSHAIVAFKKKS